MYNETAMAIDARETILTEVDGSLSHKLDQIGALVDELERRLAPILLPTGAQPAPKDGPSGPPTALSPVRASVCVSVTRLRAVEDHLSTILDRLDV